ncbi:hypothetical protein [Viscerimonas tarda]
MKLKNLLFAASMIAMLTLFGSCHELDSTDIYHYRIDYVEGNRQGAQLIYDYAYRQGVFTGDLSFTSQTTRDNDNKALDVLDENAAKIRRSDLKEILSGRSWINESRVVFYYSVFSGTMAEPILIGEREYVIDPKLW